MMLQNNPNIRVYFAGWETTLGALKMAGWKVSFNMDMSRCEYVVVLEHDLVDSVMCGRMDASPHLIRDYHLPVIVIQWLHNRGMVRLEQLHSLSFEPMGDLGIPQNPEEAKTFRDVSPFSPHSESNVYVSREDINRVSYHLEAIRGLQKTEEKEMIKSRLAKKAKFNTELSLVSVG